VAGAMSDGHIDILDRVARHSERQLRDHDATYGGTVPASDRRTELEQRATSTRARVVAALARRRQRDAPLTGRTPRGPDAVGNT
jgi:hypothetical protein